MWFQKFSILPPQKGLFLRPPPQPLWKLQSSLIHLLKFGGLNENPQPANNFQTLPYKSGYEYILELHIWDSLVKFQGGGVVVRQDKARHALFGALYSPMYIDFIQII